NSRRPGIAAVRARLEDGSLRVLAGACLNLMAEAALYRYDPEARGEPEGPLKEHDHALDALRYLCSGTDVRRLYRLSQREKPAEPSKVPPGAKPKPPWLSVHNDLLFRRVF